MAASSSMMRMRGLPAMCAVSCWRTASAAIAVVSDMNRLPLQLLRIACARGLVRHGSSAAGGRELQLEGCAGADCALDVDLAGVLLHDPVADREAEAGALVLRLPAAWSWW